MIFHHILHCIVGVGGPLAQVTATRPEPNPPSSNGCCRHASARHEPLIGTVGRVRADLSGTFLTAQLLRPRLIRHLPFTCGALTKKRLPNDEFMSLIEPLRHDPKVRRDLDKYLRSVPGKAQLLEWAEQQRAFDGPVLIVWARDEKLMPPEHAVRLTEHSDNAELVWVDDSRTLIPIDQPEALTAHLEEFLARTTTP